MWHVWGIGDLRAGFRLNVWGKRPRGRHRHRWEGDIQVNIQKI